MTEVVVVHEPNTNVTVENGPTVEVVVGDPGTQGLPGPQGPAGAPGGIGHEHIQSVAADTWPVTHGLNKYPDVSVWIDGELTEGVKVEYVNDNQVIISMNIPKTGRARFQ